MKQTELVAIMGSNSVLRPEPCGPGPRLIFSVTQLQPKGSERRTFLLFQRSC